MSNFQCSECGMINIDCGKDGYKTPREIELETENQELRRIKSEYYRLLEILSDLPIDVEEFLDSGSDI